MYQQKRNVHQYGKVIICVVFVVLFSLSLGVARAAESNNGQNVKSTYESIGHSSPQYEGIISETQCNGYGQIKKKLDDYFTQLADEKIFTGTVLIAQEDKVLLMKGYGHADFEKHTPNTPETVFAIASMGKAFTAMSIMMLEERGLLNVNDPVSKYLPEYPYAHLVTIHQLLNHTSGIYEFIQDPNSPIWNVIDQYHSPAQLMEYFMYKPLTFEPGTNYRYCNSGYEVLAYIIERVSGMTFRNFLQKNIFGPLGMKHTSYDPTGLEFKNKKATPYSSITTIPPTVSVYLHPTIAYGAGGIFSTVKDMLKWDQALYTNKLVSFQTLERMWTPGLNNYGYAWWIDNLVVDGQSHKQIWHWGSYLGYHSLISRLVEDNVTIILLMNVSNLSFAGEPELINILRQYVANVLFSPSSTSQKMDISDLNRLKKQSKNIPQDHRSFQ